MADKRIVVAAHGHCFDGLCSAALFTHLRRAIDQKGLRFAYRSCGYGPNMQTVPEKWLNGEENAIVDFRYTDSEKLDWYFDHHVTAFASDEQRDKALAEAARSPRQKRCYYDPTYSSCTKLIADVGTKHFSVTFDGFESLIKRADQIDSAGFASAADATDRRDPVMQLAAVVEQHGDGEHYDKLVPELLDKPLEDVASSAYVQELWAPIDAAQEETQARIAANMSRQGDVLFVDLHGAPLRASGKFVAYALAPDCVYSVALVRMKQHYKLSIGYNPWCQKPRRHDIALLCQRYGGGGHPVVGAVSIPLDRLEDARRIAGEVVAELNQ